MQTPSDDPGLSALFRQVRDADQSRIPSFDQVIGRPVRSKPRAVLTPVISAACAVLAVLAVGIWIAFSERGQAPDEPTHTASGTGTRVGPAMAADEVDFDRLYATVDQYFQSVKAPTWNTPTDSLFAIRLDVSDHKE